MVTVQGNEGALKNLRAVCILAILAVVVMAMTAPANEPSVIAGAVVRSIRFLQGSR